MDKKKWTDLSTPERVVVAVIALVQLSLLVAALWDIAKRPAEEINGDKRIWAGVAFINWIGPLTYFTVGRKDGLAKIRECCGRCGSA